MFLSNKTKKINLVILVLAFIISAGFLFFGNIKTSFAANETCRYFTSNTDQTGITESIPGQPKSVCEAICKEKGKTNACVYFDGTNYIPFDRDTGNTADDIDPFVANYISDDASSYSKSGAFGEQDNFCGNIRFFSLDIFKCLLLYVLRFFSWLLSVAASLFAWMVDVKVFSSVVDGPGIYSVWRTVRDLLNIAFILMLVYSAFTIIFQVDKTNKKIILTIVLMALLVNFSFPITRFIIDVSNSLMYTLIKGLLPDGGNTLFASFSQDAGIRGIVLADTSFTALIAACVFVFILAITLLAVAVLFVIRMVALVILIIFSPIAFVGAIMPGGSNYANKWWTNLFNYSFFGPIMIFMLYVAMELLKTSKGTGNILSGLANQQSTEPSVIANMAYFSVPIVLLWMGMGIAQTMSITGAGMVVSKAQSWGKWLAQRPQKGLGWVSKKAGLTDGVKARYDKFKKSGFLGTDKIEERAAGIAALGGKNKFGKFLGGDATAVKEFNRKKIQTIREDWKKQGGLEKDELLENFKKGGAVAQAAALELSDKHRFGDYAEYKQARKILENTGDNSLVNAFDDFVKKKSIHFAISYKMENPEKGSSAEQTAIKELNNISSADYKNMDFEAFFKQSADAARNATGEFFADLHPDKQRDIAKNLSKTSYAAAEKYIIGKVKQDEQPKRKLEETLKEQAQKNQEHINKQQF